jgi:peptidoglycan hydrolase-like protein with peptidoglycan-binding domain
MAALGGKIDAVAPAAAPAASTGVLRVGSTGHDVKRMQTALRIPSDGQFGPGTEAALKKWQSANGLTPDGVAGPKTLAKLLG